MSAIIYGTEKVIYGSISRDTGHIRTGYHDLPDHGLTQSEDRPYHPALFFVNKALFFTGLYQFMELLFGDPFAPVKKPGNHGQDTRSLMNGVVIQLNLYPPKIISTEEPDELRHQKRNGSTGDRTEDYLALGMNLHQEPRMTYHYGQTECHQRSKRIQSVEGHQSGDRKRHC